MAPLDWDKLMGVDTDKFEDDMEAADDMIDVLSEFEAGDEKSPERLHKLFDVCQALMLIKATQAQVAEDQLAEGAAEEGTATAKRDQDIEELKRELEILKRENKELKRFGGSSAQDADAKDTLHMRNELFELETQLERKEKEFREKDLQFIEERAASERYLERAEIAEKELKEVKRENEQLREDIKDFQRQLEGQRETMLVTRDNDNEMRDRVMQKNKLLAGALEENRNLAEFNNELERKMEEMKDEMRKGKEEIERTTEDYIKLKTEVDKSDATLDALRRENDMQKDQIDALMTQVAAKNDADDKIMVQVDRKVEEWKSILAEKDAKILDLQDETRALHDRLIAANMDSEKTSVAALTRALEERDKTIEDLRNKLHFATGGMLEDAELMEAVRDEMAKTGKGDRQLMKITHLQSTLKLHEGQLKDAETRALEAENDARDKDKELNEAVERVRLLENDIYGLPEAVSEIKELKQQLNVRDRTIEELTSHINKCEEKINDLYDEADNLRDRLGLDPLEPMDLTEYRKKKGIRMQEDRALNRILQKEIENLEEERIEMKQTIRKLAQAGGQRAVALGLEAEDMKKIDDYIENLKEERKSMSSAKIKRKVETDALQIKERQLVKEVEKKDQKLERLEKENAAYSAQTKELTELNKGLQVGLREIEQHLKEETGSGKGGVTVIECPTLEKMLQALETRNMLGTHDQALYMKAQVDNLTGHNEELRKELREVRFEATKARVAEERALSKMAVMEEEVKELKEAGAGGFYQTMSLPEGMAVASSDVIASLNEQLVQTLQELSLKEEMIAKMEDGLDNYRRKYAVVRHQQGLLYKDYITEKQKWEQGHEDLEKEVKDLQGHREEDSVQIQEFQRMMDTLGQDEPEVRRRLADMTRKITVLRVNEKALTRRYTAMQEIEGTLRKENTKLKNEMIQMERAVADRLGYLQRHKETMTFKIASLQRQLDESVPANDLDVTNKSYTELTEKYRDLLEKSNTMVAQAEQESGFEIEMKRLEEDNKVLRSELGIEKEKLHTLEAAFEQMSKAGITNKSALKSHDLTSISKKLTTLEMKELNERQRADHSQRMYAQQKQQLRNLEDRNFELESKFAELTKMNLEQQRLERDLRDELANSVTKAVSEADRAKIEKLEKTVSDLRIEQSKLKDIAEVASSQVRAFESQQISRDKEMTSLRQQLLDFQAQSDEKTIIGKLHRHIVQLQISEGVAMRKLQDMTKKASKVEAHLLRSEQRVDDKDQTLYHNRMESRSKARYLKSTIQELRRKYAGAVPLRQQERFAEQMIKLTADKNQIEEDLRKTNEERMNVQDKLQELELQHKGLQDLIVTLKDGRGAQKVAEWHSKMEQVRLEDVRLKREIDRLKQQLKFQENLLKKHEAEVLLLEENKVRQAREFETRELEWEHREVELERIIANMERMHAEVAGAATQFETAVGALPDKNLPVAEQLEIAVTTIKTNVKLVLDAKSEAAFMKKRMEEMQAELKERNKEVLSRDRVITELRLRLPASAERDKAIATATASAAKRAEDMTEDYEGEKAVRVAQSTVHHLQARIQQKDETIAKYQALLNDARQEMQSAHKRHEQELKLMQNKLHNKTDESFHKYKSAVQDSLSKQTSGNVATNDQLKRLHELEDIVADQDNSIAALREKLTKARQDTADWRFKYEEQIKTTAAEKESLMGDHSEEMERLHEQIDRLKHDIAERQKEREMLTEELEAQKDANARAPTATMKKLVERLRNELALKEKQHQALSKALMDLRADMVSQAQDDVRAHADKNVMEMNVQKLVQAQSKELQERIEELDGQNQKLKKQNKRMREREENISTDLEDTKHELARKDAMNKKIKDENISLMQDVDTLNKKVARMGTMQKQGTGGPSTSEAARQEIQDLKRKNQLLADDLKRARHQAEKPYEQQGKESGVQSHEMVTKWEESKKWQKMTDRLKERVKGKEDEIGKLMKQNDLLKHNLDRANKDKDLLEKKLYTATASPKPERAIVAKSAAPSLGAAPPSGVRGGSGKVKPHDMEDLRKRNYELEEEVTRLKRQQTQGRDAAFTEVQLRNQFLTEKLAELEQHVTQQRNQADSQARITHSQEGTVGQQTYRDLARKESDLQKRVINLSEENLELRFECEQAKKDVPRLKERIEDLQKYIEILKEEKRQLEIMRSSSRSLDSLGSLGSNLSGNYRRIGESGRTPKELEKTIMLLKKVVEKTRAENEALKRAPGVVSAEQTRNMQAENVGLKKQLEELRHKMGASLSERYVTQQKGTAKIMADHDKIGKDLTKCLRENERLRVDSREKELTIDKLRKELTDTQKRLEVALAKKPNLSSMDTKAWKATVIGKLNEEKLKNIEVELTRKNEMLSDVKVLLREAAEREHELIQINGELEEKVQVLEQFPPGAQSAQADVARNFQQARLVVDRLEKEKKELVNEIKLLRKHPDSVDSGALVRDITTHNKLLGENVELRTQVKSLEMEKNKHVLESERLKKELANFGPEFFDEIEDLKFNYREAVQRNVQYEEQLSKVSKQFGVSFDLPGGIL